MNICTRDLVLAQMRTADLSMNVLIKSVDWTDKLGLCGTMHMFIIQLNSPCFHLTVSLFR